MNDVDPIAVCSQTVFDADRERFLDIMTRPLGDRRTLFALFTLHYEIAKIPYITKEPMLAMMRLQWWRDALGTLRGGRVENHPVILALSQNACRIDWDTCDRLITARHWDIEETKFSSLDEQLIYFSDTFGALYELCAQALNQDARIAKEYGAIVGLQRYFHSVPALISVGKQAFADLSGLIDHARARASALPTLAKDIRPLSTDHLRVARDLRFIAQNWSDAAQPTVPERSLHNKWLRLRTSLL